MELLTVRIQLIDKQKEIPGDMIEAISSLVYAAQRITDLPELQVRARGATSPMLFFSSWRRHACRSGHAGPAPVRMTGRC